MLARGQGRGLSLRDLGGRERGLWGGWQGQGHGPRAAAQTVLQNFTVGTGGRHMGGVLAPKAKDSVRAWVPVAFLAASHTGLATKCALTGSVASSS